MLVSKKKYDQAKAEADRLQGLINAYCKAWDDVEDAFKLMNAHDADGNHVHLDVDVITPERLERQALADLMAARVQS